MTPIALTPPVAEPVSLPDARLFLRLDQDEEDGLLGTLITAARLMIEAASGRMLIDQDWLIVIDRWPDSGEILLPLSPVRSIKAARVYDAQGVAQSVATDALVLHGSADPPVIKLVAAGGLRRRRRRPRAADDGPAMMTLGNMRQNGARWVSLTCILPCAHRSDILVDHLADDIPVPSIGRRYRCSACGRRGPESRPAWHRGACERALKPG